MSNPWLNAEGYNDPTAYEAIRNLKEDKMKADEVWVVQGPSNTEMQVIILNVHGAYCSDTILYDEAPGENSLAVGKQYLDLGRCGFHYKDRFIKKVRSLTPQESKSIRTAIAATLGIEQRGSTEELVKARTEATIYQDLYDRLLEKVITKG